MDEFNRRDFFKVTGGITAGIGIGVLASASPFRALQRVVEWTQDQYIPEKGAETYLPALCGFCPSRCAVTLRMIGRRAVKAENGNAGCARAPLIIQSLYHPDRLRTPLKHRGKKGAGFFTPVSWDEAIPEIGSRLGTLIAEHRAASLASICHGSFGAADTLLESLLLSVGTTHICREASGETLSAAPLSLVTGAHGTLQYDLDTADCVISIGTDIFGGGFQSPDAANRFLLRMIEGKASYVQIGSVRTRSASLAAEFVAVRPGSEAVASLAVLRALTQNRAVKAQPANSRELTAFFKDSLSDDTITAITGVPADRFTAIASTLSKAKSPLICAGLGSFDASSSALSAAGILLNGVSGAFGKTIFAESTTLQTTQIQGVDALIKDDPEISMLFLYNANPVHRSPLGKECAQKLSSVDTVISFSPFLSDTDRYADYVFPAIYPIESAFAAMELVSPGGALQHPADVMLKIARVAGIKTQYQDATAAETSFSRTRTTPSMMTAPVALFKEEMERITAMTSQKRFPLTMIPREVSASGDGSMLVYPYAQKNMPEFLMDKGDLSVCVNPATAAKYALSEGDRIALASDRGTLENLRVTLSPLYPPDTIAVPTGFGHKGLTRYADGEGTNIKQIATADIEPTTGFARWYATPVRIV